jgi:aryl sulfotransferase
VNLIKTSINNGVNGRWREILSEYESMEYDCIAEEELGEECARWLITGDGK